MKKKIIIIISLIIVMFIGLIIRARIANAPTKKNIVFEKSENYKEIIDNSVELTAISKTNTINEQATSQKSSSEKGKEEMNLMLGTWVGEMSGKKLTIVITEINGKEIKGYNKLGANKRELKGTYTDGEYDVTCSKAFDANLNEPGDDKWDGVFSVKFIGSYTTEGSNDGVDCIGDLKGQEAIGEWKANNGKMKKEFNLTKK